MKNVKTLIVILMATGGIYSSLAFAIIPTPIRPVKCICLDVYDPVCITGTHIQFSNSCYAICAGFTPDQFTPCSAGALAMDPDIDPAKN